MPDVNGVKIPADQPRPANSPDALIEMFHAEGMAEGYKRVRLDRGQNTDVPAAWYEIGYSGGEVRIRWSHVGTADYQVDQADERTLSVVQTSMALNRTEARKGAS